MAKSKAKKKTATRKMTPMKAKPAKSAKKTVQKTAKKAVHKPAIKARPAKMAAKKPAAKTARKETTQKSQPMSKPAVAKKTVSNFKNFLSPLENRLFVKVVESEKRTASGLFIPDSVDAHESYIRGEVLAVGPGRKDRFGKIHRVGVEIGETVILPQHAGTPVIMEGYNFIFVRETDVIGVVE